MHTNSLIHETSPYLLQHAHNPVDWMPYGEEALTKAKSLGKPLFISIGYSACHWCHVMEHESFSDETIAAVMNKEFVCIKVDREERPDIDAIYMQSVQMIGGRGGWPLNCFAMPDGRPVWGGTYFRPDALLELLNNLASLFHSQLPDLEEQAAQLTENLHSSFSGEEKFMKGTIKPVDVQQALTELSGHLDRREGGFLGPPKFPMPVVWQMLMKQDAVAEPGVYRQHITLTLVRMAFGGIYDHVGGGFARYSTDNKWKVPHFEKMLYDNAQLISLYSEAFKQDGSALFREVTVESLEFIRHEMAAPGGGYYSALDADSEGREGRFYLWDEESWRSCLGEYADLMGRYYNLGGEGEWEHGFSILLRKDTDEDFAKRNFLSIAELKALVRDSRRSLLAMRAQRIRPGTDTKIITSWNAMMVKAHTDAYAATGDSAYLDSAISGVNFILDQLMDKQGRLFHIYAGGKAHIPGFLEDYAFFAEALLALYQVTFDEQWLKRSLSVAEYTLAHFTGEHPVMLHLAEADSLHLLVNPVETADGVIPSANAIMATTIFRLSRYFFRPDLEGKALEMLAWMHDKILENPSSCAQWLSLAMEANVRSLLVVISGKDAPAYRGELAKRYLPFVMLAGSESKSELPCLVDRFNAEKTTIYICTPDSCLQPLEDIQEAIHLVEVYFQAN
jgi:uncharacterized protein